MSGKFTEEQLRRIEENKRKALAKRAAKSQVSTGQSSVVPFQVTSSSKAHNVSNLHSSSSSTPTVLTTDKRRGESLSLNSKTSENSISKTQNGFSSNISHANGFSKNQSSSASASAFSAGHDKFKETPVVDSKTSATSTGYSAVQRNSLNRNSTNEVAGSTLSTKPLLSDQCPKPSSVGNSGGNSNAVENKGQPDSSGFNCSKTNIDYNKIEQNRLKALAKRAEKLNISPTKGSSLSFHSGLCSGSSSGQFAGSSDKQHGEVQYSRVSTNENKSHFPTQTHSNTANKAIISSSSNTKCNSNNSMQQNHREVCTGCETSNAFQNMFSKFTGTPVKGGCFLVSNERFEVEVGYSAPLIELFKVMKTKLYDAVSKRWSFKLSEYNSFMTSVSNLKPAVDIEPLPKAVLTVFSAQIKGDNLPKQIPMADLSRVEQSLVNSLMSFQREGVNFGISKNGRVLLADDMGLGKTIQAICLACFYRREWPLLVVVPSSVRFDWAQNFLRWVPSLDSQCVNVVVTGKENCTSGLINILSYDIMARKGDVLKNKRFQVVIMDECHLLKNYKTARCRAALPILQNARRVFLLSGTPAMSRPSELFTQIDAVSPFLIKFHDFGVRYCAGTKMQWGWDYSGSSNMKELQILLEEKIMIRRLKKEVLAELPDKVRKMILLDPNLIKINKDLKTASTDLASGKLKKTEEKGKLLEFFHKSGSAKMKAIKCYVEDLLESDWKFLIFAHHGDVLDGIEDTVKAKRESNYIRIDGRTNSEQRNFLCKKFQLNDDIRVAILSITAANAGLNMSSACLVVFAELFWNPGILVQAEDRAHRIGQQDMVNVQYLVARGTSDDHIWPMIQKKLDVLGKAGLSKDNFSSAETTRLTDQRQEEITKFLEESFCDDGLSPLADCDDNVEDQDMNGSHKKALRQASILKFTSPTKDMQSFPHTSCTPPKEKKPKGLFKYFSPSKACKDNIDQSRGCSHDTVDRGQSSRQGDISVDDDLEKFLIDSDDECTENDEPAVKKRKT